MGWAPASDRSMIFKRWCSRVNGPNDQKPEESGPRGARLGDMRATAEVSAANRNRISPPNPHTRRSACFREVRSVAQEPGVLGSAAAGGVDDQAARGGDAGKG